MGFFLKLKRKLNRAKRSRQRIKHVGVKGWFMTDGNLKRIGPVHMKK